MFGFGKKKKKKRDEFVAILSDLGNINKDQAEQFFNENEGFIQQSFSRGLDPFSAVAYVAESSMEKIHDAHHIDDLSLIADIPDYLLLVGLQAVKIMQNAKVPSDQLDFNFRYWNLVIKLPINPNEPDFTYGDRLQELVDEYQSKSN